MIEGDWKGKIIEQLSLHRTIVANKCGLRTAAWVNFIYEIITFFFNNIVSTALISTFPAGNVSIILWEHGHIFIPQDELPLYLSTIN